MNWNKLKRAVGTQQNDSCCVPTARQTNLELITTNI
jgi:hypothetical protein